MFADFREFSDRIEQIVRHPVGMRGQEADPFQAVDLVQYPQQVLQARSIFQIHPVAVDDLAQEGDLAHTLLHQRAALTCNLADRPAAFDAAPEGDDAEGTGVRAAIDDGHIGGNERSLLGQREFEDLRP